MLPELKITQLRYFVLVAQLKSFHGAARQAYRTQPAMSLAVRELEQKLGQALFEKGGENRTDALWRALFAAVPGPAAHHDRIAREVSLLARHEIGQVSIATVPSVASRLLPHLLAGFVAEHPKMQISIQDGMPTASSSYWSRGRWTSPSAAYGWRMSSIDFVPILSDRVGVVCRHDHPLVARRARCIGPACKAIRWSVTVPHDCWKAPMREGLLEHSRLSVSNMISLIAMLEEGVGISTLPYLAFPQENEQACVFASG